MGGRAWNLVCQHEFLCALRHVRLLFRNQRGALQVRAPHRACPHHAANSPMNLAAGLGMYLSYFALFALFFAGKYCGGGGNGGGAGGKVLNTSKKVYNAAKKVSRDRNSASGRTQNP